MADRSVSVKLLADVTGFVSGVQRASAESKKLAGDLGRHAKDNKQAYETVGKTLLGVGLAAGAGVLAATSSFARFDQQMSLVAAASGEAGASLEALRQAAVTAGAETAFSATEAAQGITELSKAGVSASDILGGGLSGALDLAAAGGLGVGEAAEIAATAMTQFGLAGEDVTHVADLLAAGAGKAQGDVTDLGGALKQSGLVASQTGLSIEETTGALTAFASAGLLGSDAGTSFKSMLQRLTPQSEEAAGLMSELGINAYDAQGQFIGLSEFAGVLQGALADLTPEQRNSALATIFGSDAVRAAAIIYEEGAAGVSEWEAAVNDSGYAAEQAAAKLDNLLGDLEAFGGSVETALIGMGEASNGPLRELVQDATTMVNVFNDLPPAVQQVVVPLGAATAGVGLLGGALFLALPRLQASVTALAAMGPAGAKAATGIRAASAASGPWILGLTAFVGVASLVVDSTIDQKQAVDDYAATLDQATAAVTGLTREEVKRKLAEDGALEAARNLGITTTELTNAVLEGGDAYDRVTGSLNETSAANRSLNEAQAATSGMANQTSSDITRVREALDDQTGALAKAKDEVRLLAETEGLAAGARYTAAASFYGVQAGATAASGAMAGVTEEAVSAEDEITNLDAALAALFDGSLSVQDAMDDVEQAIADMAEATATARSEGVAPLTESVYANTQAGRDNRDSIDATIRAIGAEASARAAQGEGLGAITTRTYQARDALVAQMVQMGYTEAEAREYVGTLNDVPALVQTNVTTPGMARAIADADYLKRSLDNIPKSVSVSLTTYATTIRQDIAASNRGGTQPRSTGQADGGFWQDGNLTRAASGLMRDSQIVKGGAFGAGILWAEPETGWEAYISGKPGQRNRNLGILAEAASRLGAGVVDRGRGAMGGGALGGGGAAGRSVTIPVTVHADEASTARSYADAAVLRLQDAIMSNGLSGLVTA